MAVTSICMRLHECKPVSCAGACRPSFDGCRHSSVVWQLEAARLSIQEAWSKGGLCVGYTYGSMGDGLLD